MRRRLLPGSIRGTMLRTRGMRCSTSGRGGVVVVVVVLVVVVGDNKRGLAGETIFSRGWDAPASVAFITYTANFMKQNGYFVREELEEEKTNLFSKSGREILILF